MISFGRSESADVRVETTDADLTGTRFVLGGQHSVALGIPGAHHSCNAAAAWIVGRELGLSTSCMIERIGAFAPGDGRAKVVESGGVTIVDDSYNANPASMLAVVETLGRSVGAPAIERDDRTDRHGIERAVRGRRVLVMGDMLELGVRSPEFHERVLRCAIKSGIELVVAVGERYGAAVQSVVDDAPQTTILTCVSSEEVARSLTPRLSRGDCVWIKGSRSMGLERAVEQLRHRLEVESKATQSRNVNTHA